MVFFLIHGRVLHGGVARGGNPKLGLVLNLNLDRNLNLNLNPSMNLNPNLNPSLNLNLNTEPTQIRTESSRSTNSCREISQHEFMP